MRARRRLLVLLAAPFLGLLLAEVVVRGLGLRPPARPETRGGVIAPVDDPLLRFENRPSAEKVKLYRDHPGAPPRAVVMRTNAQRFRGPEVAPEKPAGTLRVACLGDSHTFGEGVGEGETWPAHLRRRAAPGAAVEVLNCGVNGYDTLQEALWFERRVLPFAPDVVVLAYFANDVAARDVGPAEAKPGLLRKLVHPRRGGCVAALRGSSRALDLLCDALHRRGEAAGYAADLRARYAADAPGWERVQRALAKLRERCEERGIDLHLVTYPYVELDGDRFHGADLLALVRERAAALGIPVHDPAPELRAAAGAEGSLRVSPADYHANATAHAAFADSVADYLARRGLPFRRR